MPLFYWRISTEFESRHEKNIVEKESLNGKASGLLLFPTTCKRFTVGTYYEHVEVYTRNTSYDKNKCKVKEDYTWISCWGRNTYIITIKEWVSHMFVFRIWNRRNLNREFNVSKLNNLILFLYICIY